MTWIVENLVMITFAIVANFTLNLSILAWSYQDEGGIRRGTEKDSKCLILYQSFLLWESIVLLSILAVCAIAIGMILMMVQEVSEYADALDGPVQGRRTFFSWLGYFGLWLEDRVVEHIGACLSAFLLVFSWQAAQQHWLALVVLHFAANLSLLWFFYRHDTWEDLMEDFRQDGVGLVIGGPIFMLLLGWPAFTVIWIADGGLSGLREKIDLTWRLIVVAILLVLIWITRKFTGHRDPNDGDTEDYPHEPILGVMPPK